MAFGRKAKRIAELEGQLKHAMENLAVARVSAFDPTVEMAVPVEKMTWYRASYNFRHTGGLHLEISGLVVTHHEGQARYFDGSIP